MPQRPVPSPEQRAPVPLGPWNFFSRRAPTANAEGPGSRTRESLFAFCFLFYFFHFFRSQKGSRRGAPLGNRRNIADVGTIYRGTSYRASFEGCYIMGIIRRGRYKLRGIIYRALHIRALYIGALYIGALYTWAETRGASLRNPPPPPPPSPR